MVDERRPDCVLNVNQFLETGLNEAGDAPASGAAPSALRRMAGKQARLPASFGSSTPRISLIFYFGQSDVFGA